MGSPLSPSKTSLSFFVQETWKIPISCFDRVSGQPLDITGGYVLLRISTLSALMFDISLEASGADFSSGKATMVIAVGDQANVVSGTFNYEIRSISADGNTNWVQQYGVFSLQQSLFAQFGFVPPGHGSGTLDFSDPFQSGLLGH